MSLLVCRTPLQFPHWKRPVVAGVHLGTEYSLSKNDILILNPPTALVHASPIYHAIYRHDRDSILKATTLRTLSAWGIKPSDPTRIPPVYVLAHQVAKALKPENAAKLKYCYEAATAAIREDHKPTIILTCDQYLALRNVGQRDLARGDYQRRSGPYWGRRGPGFFDFRLLNFDTKDMKFDLKTTYNWGWARCEVATSPWEALGAIEIT